MLDSLTKPATIRACPIELLVRSEFGPGFDRYVRTHDVTRVVPGVYAHTPAWLRLPPWGQYLARVHAVRWKRPSAVFVFEAAAALLGVPFIGVPAHVHIAADKKGAARISGAVQGHFFTDPLVTTEAGGFTTTTRRIGCTTAASAPPSSTRSGGRTRSAESRAGTPGGAGATAGIRSGSSGSSQPRACRACGRATTRGCARSRICSARGVSRRR